MEEDITSDPNVTSDQSGGGGAVIGGGGDGVDGKGGDEEVTKDGKIGVCIAQSDHLTPKHSSVAKTTR